MTPRSAAGWLPTLALALALPLPLGSLPPFRLGYWVVAEPLQIWLHAAAALGSLAIVVLLAVEPARVGRCLRHPLVVTTAAIGLWSAVAAPLVPLPLLSLFGTVQSGLGALWFLDAAILIACALVVAEQPRHWRLLAWEAVAVVAVVAAVKFSDDTVGPEQAHLIHVAAYYGWLGVYIPFLARPWRDDRDRWLAVATVAVAVPVVIASQSLTAGALLAGIVAYPAAAWLGQRHPPVVRLTESKAAAIAVVLAAAFLPYLGVHLWGGATASASLHDRFHLQQMMQAALRADPSLVLGHGWGRTQDAFHAFLNVTGETLWKPTWIFLTSDYFNAHNWLLETLYAAGIPGVVLIVVAALALALTATSGDRAAATALAAAGLLFTGLWFQLVLSLPLMALAMAAVAAPTAAPRPGGRAATAAAMAVVAGLGLGQAWAAGRLLAFGHAITAVQRDITVGRKFTLPDDPRGSDLAAAEFIRDSFLAMAQHGRQPPDAEAAGAMLDYLQRRIPLTETTQLPVIGLEVLAQIYFIGNLAWLAPAIHHPDALWRAWLDRVLALAPGRTDAAISYLTRLATSGRVGELAALAGRILDRDADDPVGLYYAGLAELLQPDAAAKRSGIELLRRSAADGIERFMPLDPAVVKVIRLAGPAG